MLGSARRWRLLALGLGLTFVVAACGSNNSGGGSTATTKASGVDQALAAKVPAAVKADGKLLIGTDSTYAPSEFLDTDGKTVIGFDVDLFNAVAAKLGLKAEYQPAKFDAIIPGVQSGKYEIGVSSFTINDGTQWAAKKGNPSGIQPDAACGKKVAVQTSTVQDTDDLPKRLKACTSTGKPAFTVDRYQDQGQATASVVTGKDDGMLADSPVVAYAVKHSQGQLEALGAMYDSAPYGYVVKKDQTDFAQALADAVKALISDGTYKTVLQKWGVDAGGIDSPAVNP